MGSAESVASAMSSCVQLPSISHEENPFKGLNHSCGAWTEAD